MRTDIHRPSAINPADYDYVCLGYQRVDGMDAVALIKLNRTILADFQKATGAEFSQHEHGGSCHICGASAIYTVIFHHRATNTLIRTGCDCAMKMEMSADFAAINRFRAAIQDAREANAGKKKAVALLSDKNLSQLWDIYTAEANDLPKQSNGAYCREELTVRDIVGKLVKYGSISDAQWRFLYVLDKQITQRPIIAAKRAAEVALVPAIQAGRYEISGMVLKGEWRQSQFGSVYKITVKNDAGQVFWGTSPSSIGEVKYGDKVAFVATVETSDKPNFAFFKRPTNGKELAVAAGQ